MIWRYLQGTRRAVLARAAVLIAVIALLDWRVDLNIYFGFLYVFPMLLVGTVLSRWPILFVALLCTVLSEFFDPFRFGALAVVQDVLVFSALSGMGLLSQEVTRSRQRERENLNRVEQEMSARREAEEQLEFLVQSSPAAILTMTQNGKILLANRAAHRLFGVSEGVLPGRSISRYIAALGCVPSVEETPQAFRTEMQCRGERENGDVFLANVFFSTYKTAVGPRLAALVVDASEELRDREEYSLERLLAGSRILVAAVSHEVRNVCGAISVIYENLIRHGALKNNTDFEALGSLVETLNKIASLELRQSTSNPEAQVLDLKETLDDLRIVLEPYCEESDIRLRWEIPGDLPAVWADRPSLLQVLLNLTKNSGRALENSEVKQIDISVAIERKHVLVRVTDTGPGIASAERLFQPLQKGADSTGLGLFLSRAFMRSFRGDLRHDPDSPGCCFVIELAIAGDAEPDQWRAGTHATDTTLTAR
jgi:two-component system sensor kinase FixL